MHGTHEESRQAWCPLPHLNDDADESMAPPGTDEVHGLELLLMSAVPTS